MVISISYIASIIILIVSFLLLKKSDEKQNLIKWICISMGLLFCFNSIVCYFLSLVKIPIYLKNLSIINFSMAILFLILIFISRKRQKYYVEKKDIISISAISLVLIIICLQRFGFPFNIVYEGSDPGTHFWTAKDFYEHSQLLGEVSDKTIVNFEARQFASYTNVGIMFKVFSPFMHIFDFYYIYILFDIIMLLLSSWMFYFLISSSSKKVPYLFILIGTLLYTLGYPLNNMLIGFFYLGHSVMLITLLFMLFKMYDNNMVKEKIIYSLLFIVILGIMFTYSFFISTIVGGLVLYLIYKNRKNILTRKNILVLLLLFVIPCIIGFSCFISPNLGNVDKNAVKQITLDGGCYIDILSSIILFVPIIIYYVYSRIKEKNIPFELFVYLALVVFTSVIIILLLLHRASMYYLSKPYYLFWLLNFVIFFKFIDKHYHKPIFGVNWYLGIMLTCVTLSIFNVSKMLDNLAPSYTDSNFSIPFSIYSYNVYALYSDPLIILNHSELSELKEVYKLGTKNIASNAIPQARLWLASYFETRTIEYPENQLYDYIDKHYQYFGIISEEELSDIEENNVILFYRLGIIEFELKKTMKLFDINNLNDYTNSLYDSHKEICSDCYIKKYKNFLYIEKKISN